MSVWDGKATDVEKSKPNSTPFDDIFKKIDELKYSNDKNGLDNEYVKKANILYYGIQDKKGEVIKNYQLQKQASHKQMDAKLNHLGLEKNKINDKKAEIDSLLGELYTLPEDDEVLEHINKLKNERFNLALPFRTLDQIIFN